LHYPRNSQRALGRIGKDSGLTVVFVLVAIVGAWLAEKQMSIGVIGLVGVGDAFYYIFLTLRDLWQTYRAPAFAIGMKFTSPHPK
jgi:hypothetical protein